MPPAKRAVMLWMRRAAARPEWAGSGIPLNAVAPGTVRTAMIVPLLQTKEGRDVLRRSTPIATMDYGDPEDLAEVIAFLATMRTAYLFGHVIGVDGGVDMLMRPEQV